YDGNNLLRELDDVGATEAEFTCLPQQACAEVISQRRDTDSSFYLWDGISNIRQLTDDLEVVTDEYAFAAFGTLRSSTGSTANSQQYKGRLIAYRKDPNAGPETEYSLHHRNYNPATGVFKSQDPAKDDLNLYRYVKNNPVNRTDPSGLLDDSLLSNNEQGCQFFRPYVVGPKHNGGHYVGETVQFHSDNCSRIEFQTSRRYVCRHVDGVDFYITESIIDYEQSAWFHDSPDNWDDFFETNGCQRIQPENCRPVVISKSADGPSNKILSPVTRSQIESNPGKFLPRSKAESYDNCYAFYDGSSFVIVESGSGLIIESIKALDMGTSMGKRTNTDVERERMLASTGCPQVDQWNAMIRDERFSDFMFHPDGFGCHFIDMVATCAHLSRHRTSGSSAVFDDQRICIRSAELIDDAARMQQSQMQKAIGDVESPASPSASQSCRNQLTDLHAVNRRLLEADTPDLRVSSPAGRGVWDLHPFRRGRVIEQQLGQNLPDNFPSVDCFQNGVATSIKSMDLDAATYSDIRNITSTGRRYIDSVATFQGRKWAGVNIRLCDISARNLYLAVPVGATQAQRQALQDLVTYGTQNGVTVRIVVVP
ncbi:MAG: hypothetical protein JNL58_32265, partial [Planctomyces sp.]|nr:hypothetical protein [Planctomyces sp.]